jgi:hypothetical protein
MIIVRKLLLLLLAVAIINGEISISSSNYLTVSRLSLKSADVITLTPQGWLSRALKAVPVTNIRDSKNVYNQDNQRGSFKIPSGSSSDSSRYSFDD